MDRAAVDRGVAELVAEYGSPGACPGALLCDRHRGEAVAFTIVEPDLSYRDLTFGELGDLSARFAAGLAGLGVGPGDAVATLMGKSADLGVALLGIWRRGAAHVPLFTAVAPPAIAFRLARSDAKAGVGAGRNALLHAVRPGRAASRCVLERGRPGLGLRPVLRNPRATGGRDAQHPAARRILRLVDLAGAAAVRRHQFRGGTDRLPGA